MNIELSEIQRLITRTQDIETQLLKDFADMINELNDIVSNVRSSSLVSSNNNLLQAIDSTSNTVSTNLPQIIAFLSTQAANYERTNANAKEQIDSLVSAVNSSFGPEE